MAMTKALVWLWRYPAWLQKLQQEQDELTERHGSALTREVRIATGVRGLHTPCLCDCSHTAVLPSYKQHLWPLHRQLVAPTHSAFYAFDFAECTAWHPEGVPFRTVLAVQLTKPACITTARMHAGADREPRCARNCAGDAAS